MMRWMWIAWLLAGAAPAFGQHPSGERGPVGEAGVLEEAPYRVDVPANWNRGLVVLFHGYEVVGQARPDPYRALRGTEAFLRRGYAVIQSGYSRQGWAVAEARADTRRLRQVFERRFGRPERVFAAGFSMGGHLALATVEQEARSYDGALALCPVALPATELFDRAIVELAAAQALFPGIIPDLAAPSSPPAFDGGALGRALATNQAAAAQLAALTDIRAPDLPGALFVFYAATREMMQRAGGFPGSNRDFRYRGFGDDAAFNARVRRYHFSPAARRYAAANATLTGRISDPVVIQANVYDDLVANRTTITYPHRVRSVGRASRLTLMPPVGDGHCNFTADQIGAAFDRLVAQANRPRR